MTNDKKIRVLCVDDHPIVREGIMGILSLQSDMELVGEAASGAEASEAFNRLRPDVMLLDLRLRDTSGFDVIRKILSEFSHAKILVLTSLEGDADMERALALGALGYVIKGSGREELILAIRDVDQGRRHIPPNVAQTLAAHLVSEKLTSRELEVLTHMAQGQRNKEIGASMSIAEDTVKMHVKNVLAKLGVSDRTEAVTKALQRGLIHLPIR
jgi:DNA-binding NarL/FixJ family response regulator